MVFLNADNSSITRRINDLQITVHEEVLLAIIYVFVFLYFSILVVEWTTIRTGEI